MHSSIFLGFPCGSAGKESTCTEGDLGSIPGLGRPRGEGKGYPLQYSGLENSIDYIVHGVAKSQTWLSNFHFQTQRVNRESTTTPNPCCFFGLVSESTVGCRCIRQQMHHITWSTKARARCTPHPRKRNSGCQKLAYFWSITVWGNKSHFEKYWLPAMPRFVVSVYWLQSLHC